MENKFNSSHIIPGAKTNEIMLNTSSYVHGNDARHSEFFTGTERREEQFLQDAERNAAYIGKFNCRYFMYIGPGSEETSKFDKYPDNSKGKCTQVYFCTEASNLERMQKLPKRES